MVDNPSPASSMIPAAAGAAVAVAEAAVPGLIAFNPIFAIILTAIRAHYNATQTFPSEADVLAAVPVEYQQIIQGWASWKPSGDGTLPPAKTEPVL